MYFICKLNIPNDTIVLLYFVVGTPQQSNIKIRKLFSTFIVHIVY